MNLKRVKGMHVIRCEVCGKERKSPKPPGKKYTPKVCAACHGERQREILCRMLNQHFEPRRPS